MLHDGENPKEKLNYFLMSSNASSVHVPPSDRSPPVLDYNPEVEMSGTSQKTCQNNPCNLCIDYYQYLIVNSMYVSNFFYSYT